MGAGFGILKQYGDGIRDFKAIWGRNSGILKQYGGWIQDLKAIRGRNWAEFRIFKAI